MVVRDTTGDLKQQRRLKQQQSQSCSVELMVRQSLTLLEGPTLLAPLERRTSCVLLLESDSSHVNGPVVVQPTHVQTQPDSFVFHSVFTFSVCCLLSLSLSTDCPYISAEYKILMIIHLKHVQVV